MNSADHVRDRLLPDVRRIKGQSGVCPIPTHLNVAVEDGRVRLAAERWLSEIRTKTKLPVQPCELTIVLDSGIPRDGFRLRVGGKGVVLQGGSPEGCFHGLQTLRQLAGRDATLPFCEVEDWPDFATRGLLHDTTRGKVPTIGTLKLLADRLASLKLNQLQLYIEHSFVFEFDRTICDESNGLTADEIRELDRYCHERFIELVPAVATLGHMGRILALPQYHHLAEVAPASMWEELPWPQRARGFTLDVLNPESHKLVERIWGEILDAFPSKKVNICGDEPWDLAKGRNKNAIATDKVGDVYIDAILRTNAICARRGRRTQVWSDVVNNHPNLFARLPPDLTVLHWGYDDRSDYAGTKAFVDAGLETICCPGTTGWKRVLNAIGLAERNIATFAEAGKSCGAAGLINTDWGDHGHFNALACSWHGIALGAVRGWHADHPIGSDFDRRFVPWLFNDDGEDGVTQLPQGFMDALRQTARIADTCETWRLLWQPVEEVRTDPNLPTVEAAEAAARSAHCAINALKSSPSGIDRDELITACESTVLFCDKVRLAHENNIDRGAVNDRLKYIVESLTQSWNARNKPSGLRDIRLALDHVGAEFK